MSNLQRNEFGAFFRELHGHDPYPWQERLAAKAMNGQWPGAIDLPTGSGKTACIDIAIFALACQAGLPVEQRRAPRRIFFCVNRRVIVAEAYMRARSIARKIWEAEQNANSQCPVLQRVAKALRTVSGTADRQDLPPMDALELRGGIRRDNRWARSIIQPVVICTTLDQLGSRLLFRGYGVSRNTAPIQAALVAYDSLILLDEAHISEPFRQTLDYVRGYLEPTKWAQQDIGVQPLQYVAMTATPTDAMRQRGLICLEGDDRVQPRLRDRLLAPKPAQLEQVTDVSKAAVKQVTDCADQQPLAIGIIVNRIATARKIHTELLKQCAIASDRKRKMPSDTCIELVIGSMRPLDRDRQAERLRELVGPDRPKVTQTPSITIATQCLEVGADYDFDVLITECASLDALRQRFGRLNRAGRKRVDGSYTPVRATILIDKKDAKDESKLKADKPLDPIYGNAMVRTWHWLQRQAGEGCVNFGLAAFEQLLTETTDDGRPPDNLLSPQALLSAPVMLPVYVDFWCQTAPQPAPDPEPALFIHGSNNSEPDIQVCWRADLVDDDIMTTGQWCDVVAILPPTSAECISLPISRLRRWLALPIVENPDTASDTLGLAEDDPQAETTRIATNRCRGVLWRGPDNSRLLQQPGDLRPGDTVVLPATAPDSGQLGHIPLQTVPDDVLADTPAAVSDIADEAGAAVRDQAVLRLHPTLQADIPAFKPLLDAAARIQEPLSRQEWHELLGAVANAIDPHDPRAETLEILAQKDQPLRIESYPDHRGVLLTTQRRLQRDKNWFIRAMDEGDDASSGARFGTEVTLVAHSSHVRDKAAKASDYLPLNGLGPHITTASWLHDWGKADERFQAMLRRTDRTDAWLYQHANTRLLAKSGAMATTPAQRHAARERAGLPQGFRHEMLSLQLAEKSGQLPDDPRARDLILHLIAAHHGHARPFAPVVPDEELPDVTFQDASLDHEERQQLVPPHRLDSGIGERFWRLTRRYGWWGLAYLEAVLRLADQQASAAEQAGEYADGDMK